MLGDPASSNDDLLVTRNLSHALSGLDSPLQWKDLSCLGFCGLPVLKQRDGVLLCVSLCCTASSGVSAHLRPGCCSLAHILSSRQGEGKHQALVPSLAV